MPKLNVLITGSTGYIGVQLIMEDGSKRAKIFGDIELTKEVATKLKGWKIYTDVANPRKNPQPL